MRRLAFAELRHGAMTWVGVVLVAAMASLTSCLALSFLETGVREVGSFLENAASFLTALLMFSLPGAVIVTSTVADLAVGLNRAAYARWQLAGVSPGQASAVVLIQLAVAGLTGAALGFAAATVAVPPFVRAVFSLDSLGWDRIPFVVGPLTAAVAIPLTVVVTLLGGLRAARMAARTPPLTALREPEPEVRRLRWWRWLLLVAVAAAVWSGLAGILGAQDLRVVTSQLPLLPVYAMVLVAAAGPLIYPVVLRVWTALIPARVSTSWYLARHQARYHLGRSTASITPLFVGASLLGGLMTVAATMGATMAAAGAGGNWTLEILQVLLLIGGPVLLGAVGAAVVIFMSNRTQAAEQALLRASGAADGTVIASAALQALIHVATAALLAAIALVTTTLIAAAGLSRFVMPVPVVDAGAAAVLIVIGLLLTTVATTAPTLSRLHEPIMARLAGS